MEHMPFILILQTLVLVIVEKFTFKIPRKFKKYFGFFFSLDSCFKTNKPRPELRFS